MHVAEVTYVSRVKVEPVEGKTRRAQIPGKEEPKMMEEKGKEKEKMKEMPKTGGPGIGMLLPASVLLLGSGIVAFAVVRRRG